MEKSYEHLKKARPYALALRPLRNLILSVIAVMACGFFVLMSTFSYLGGNASKRWPSVDGRILKSEVSEITEKTSRKYRPEVTYVYEVNGRVFEGNQIYAGGEMSKKKAELDLLVGEFAVGNKVPVYYDPEDPEKACLVKGVDDSFPLVMVAFGLGLMFSCRKMLTSGRELRHMIVGFSQMG